MTAEVRCPKCGRRTSIRTAREDGHKYYVCINYPGCKGTVPVDEGWGNDWGKEKPAKKITHDSPRQRKASASPERRSATTIRTVRKDEHKGHAGVKPPQRKGQVLIDEGWGDDWGKEKPATKTTHDSPRQRKASASPERKSATTIRIVRKDERKGHAGVKPPQRKGQVLIDDGWGDDWGKEKSVPKTASYRSQYPGTRKRAVASEEKKPARLSLQKLLKKGAAPEKRKPSEPLRRIAPKEDSATEKKESPKLRQRRVPQQYLAPEKKKRSNIVIIIALVIAFLAIDGMIYAAFVLR